jgi:hypothetical protein
MPSAIRLYSKKAKIPQTKMTRTIVIGERRAVTVDLGTSDGFSRVLSEVTNPSAIQLRKRIGQVGKTTMNPNKTIYTLAFLGRATKEISS